MTERARVLIVDDDVGTCETLADVLETRGFEAVAAQLARAGLGLLAAGPVDVAIVDIMLPDMSGLSLLEAVKAASPSTEVIFITGHASLPTAIRAINSAAFAYVVKPFEMDHLLSVVERAVERRRLTGALQETNQTLQALIEASPLPIWTVDRDGLVLVWNAAAARTFGWSRDEVVGRRLPTVPPDKVDEARRLRAASLEGETQVSVETQRLRADGRRMEVNLSIAPLRDAAGSIRGVVTIVSDITERKRAEQALRDSESSFRLLFADNPLPMWVYDLETMAFLEVNATAVARYGYTRDEFMRMGITDITPAEDVPRVLQFLEREPLTGRRYSGQWRHRLRDGSIIDTRIWAHAMTLSGRRAGLAVVEDITEQRRAEAALLESSQALEAVIQSTPAAVMALDLNGRVTRWNRSAERVFGWSEAEVLDRPIPIIPEDSSDAWWQSFARWKRGEVVTDLEVHRRRKDGSMVPISLSVAPLRDGAGSIVGTTANLVDITERKQLEEQLRQAQKLEAIGGLAGGIAHDFNNLLTVIAGRAHLMKARLDPDSPLHHDMDLIAQTVDRAARLTRQLLAFSRKQVLEPRVLDLGAAVKEIQLMLRRLIGEHIDLAAVSTPGLWRVRVDPSQIEQVIMNLAVNARDAMPEGGRLTIETENVELDETYTRAHADVEPGPYVMLAVSDTGHGMDAEIQSKLFVPFFTTKEPGRGTGLGLSTVYGIVKQSGGHIWVYSEVGRGSSFKIYLPRVTEAADADAVVAAPARGGTETILLVEDEQEVRVMAREMLLIAGYTVLVAAHAEEALAVARRHSGVIHLLLTDVVMPGMSGRALADRLVAERADLKVLFMSGYPSTAIAQHGVLDPGTRFLQKPFTPSRLAETVRDALEGGTG